MPAALIENSVVNGSGNAYVDGSGNAYVVIVPTVVTTVAGSQPSHIPGAEWQTLDWEMEVNRLKSWWG